MGGRWLPISARLGKSATADAAPLRQDYGDLLAAHPFDDMNS
jgi:hypothetical protein